MLDPVRAKARWLGATAVAFTGGVLLASGLEWTAGSQAALLQASPSRDDVQPLAEMSQAFISIAEAVTPAVVTITTERPAGRARGGPEIPEELRGLFPPMPRNHPQGPQIAGGSGFILQPDGYIMTNNHVIEGATKITVVFQDNRQLQASLIGRDPTTDIAVIKVETTDLPTVRFGRSEATRIGEWVLAIGNPLQLGTTVTSGIISAKGRGLGGIIAEHGGGQWAIEDFLQTDAPINPGNSGGPLVNLRGEVIGVNSAIASPTGLYSGYGFAVPVDLARKVGNDLIRYGRVRRPALGVQIRDVSPEDAEYYRLPSIDGVLVQDFPEDSPARRAGLRSGDVIVAVDGQRAERTGQLQRLIASRQPGETVTLEVIRGGKRQSFRVGLQEAPVPTVERTATAPAPPPVETRLGVQVQPLTPELARQFGFGDTEGLVVTGSQPYGAAWRAGIREGTRIIQVDGNAVRSVEAFQRIVEGKRPNEILSLVVGSPQGQRIVNLRMPG